MLSEGAPELKDPSILTAVSRHSPELLGQANFRLNATYRIYSVAFFAGKV